MIIKELKLKGVYEIQLETVPDKRGNFTRIFDDKIFKEYNLNYTWVQENQSFSKHKNTIRGLHFQLPPHSETKLVRVVVGEIYDVFLDLRKDSQTFGEWESIILSSNNNKTVLIPRGFAHGYCTLTDNCEVLYKVDNYYNPHKESGIKWNDPDLGINFPITVFEPTISAKDSNLKGFKSFIEIYGSLDVRGATEDSSEKTTTLFYKDKNLD